MDLLSFLNLRNGSASKLGFSIYKLPCYLLYLKAPRAPRTRGPPGVLSVATLVNYVHIVAITR